MTEDAVLPALARCVPRLGGFGVFLGSTFWVLFFRTKGWGAESMGLIGSTEGDSRGFIAPGVDPDGVGVHLVLLAKITGNFRETGVDGLICCDRRI